jgi:hypothetical protein
MIDRVVLISLGGCVVLSAALYRELSVDISSEQRPLAQAEAPVTARPPAPGMNDLVPTLLAAPLFFENRKLPERNKVDRSVQHPMPNIRLTGIVIKPERPLAIFGVPGAKPLVRGEGDTIEGWRLGSIEHREVSLVSPEGNTAILTPKADPNLVRESAKLASAPVISRGGTVPALAVPATATALPGPSAPTNRPGPVFPPARGMTAPRPAQ